MTLCVLHRQTHDSVCVLVVQMRVVIETVVKSKGFSEFLQMVNDYPPSSGPLLVTMITAGVEKTKISRSKPESMLYQLSVVMFRIGVMMHCWSMQRLRR